MQFPPNLKHIQKFCQENNVAVNVFQLHDNGKNRAATISKIAYSHNELTGCNLLFYTNRIRGYYLLYTNKAKFYHRAGDGHTAYPCLQCDERFTAPHVLY